MRRRDMNMRTAKNWLVLSGSVVVWAWVPVFAQSTLHCPDCHSVETATWLLGRHAKTQSDVAGELAASWAGQPPDSVINGSQAEDCLACHSPVAVSTLGGMTEVQAMGHFFTTSGGLYTLLTIATDTTTWPHVACVSCHDVAGDHPDTTPILGIFRSNTAVYDAVTTSSMLCGQCHGTLKFQDTDHRIYSAWKMSKHGHGGQAHIAGELADSWAGQPPDSVINGSAAEDCIACHAPTSVPQLGAGTEVSALRQFFTTTGGLFTPLTTVADTTHWPDVACTSCHNPHNPGALSYYNSSSRTYQVMTESSMLCGQCHGSLRFPDTDHRSYDLELGTGGIGVPNKVTMPGATCVDCHMGKSEVDGTNSLMFKGHRWAPIFKEPDGSTFATCTSCHPGITADSAVVQIALWKAEYASLDSIAEALYTTADSIAEVRHDTTKLHLVADARHNLDMVEMDESGGYHNHLYAVSLLNDAIARTQLVTGVKTASAIGLPTHFEVFQNYPNPFNPATEIRYQVPTASWVTLTVYDVLGREVSTLVNEQREPGVYEVLFNGSGIASGVYIYRLQAGQGRNGFLQTRKMLLVK